MSKQNDSWNELEYPESLIDPTSVPSRGLNSGISSRSRSMNDGMELTVNEVGSPELSGMLIEDDVDKLASIVSSLTWLLMLGVIPRT